MADRSIKIPEFSGDPVIDKMTVVAYLHLVDMSRNAGVWTDAITAEKVKLKLTGPALIWLQNRMQAGTEGLAVYEPDAVGDVRPPGLRALLTTRFMPQQTAGEQERLRSSLIQGEHETVQNFYDRVESIQFILDLEYPEAFRRDSKALYDIVHDRHVRGNFITGVKPDIRKHIITLDVATLQDALTAAVAFEKARAPPKTAGAVSCATGGELTIDARIAALELQKREGGGDRSPGKLADEGCFYCGYIGHNKAVCRIRAADEEKGIFQKRCEGYQPGRVGKKGGQTRGRGAPQRGGNQYRGGQNRGGYSYRAPQPWQQNRGRGGQQGYGYPTTRGGYAHAAGGGYTHATGGEQIFLQPPTPQPPVRPTVPMPGWDQGYFPPGPPSHNSSDGMNQYFQDFNSSLGSMRFETGN
jgi:hypothetical protein